MGLDGGFGIRTGTVCARVDSGGYLYLPCAFPVVHGFPRRGGDGRCGRACSLRGARCSRVGTYPHLLAINLLERWGVGG